MKIEVTYQNVVENFSVYLNSGDLFPPGVTTGKTQSGEVVRDFHRGQERIDEVLSHFTAGTRCVVRTLSLTGP